MCLALLLSHVLCFVSASLTSVKFLLSLSVSFLSLSCASKYCLVTVLALSCALLCLSITLLSRVLCLSITPAFHDCQTVLVAFRLSFMTLRSFEIAPKSRNIFVHDPDDSRPYCEVSVGRSRMDRILTTPIIP